MRAVARLVCYVCVAAATLSIAAQKTANPPVPAPPKTTAPTTKSERSGETVFRNNCHRCHSAPEDLSPRITGTVIRHMRVRANLSAQDEQRLLEYLAP